MSYNNLSKKRAWTLIIVLLIASALVGFWAVTAESGQKIVINGLEHIQNSDIPYDGTEVWNYEEVWRVGGYGDDTLFKFIERVMADSSGNIYVLDSGMSQLHIYSRQGQLNTSVDLFGYGPGEVVHPLEMFFLPDNTIGLFGNNISKIVRIDYQGLDKSSIFVNTYTVNPIAYAEFAQSWNNIFMIAVMDINFTAIVKLSMDGSEIDSYARQYTKSDREQLYETDGYFMEYCPWAIGPYSQLFVTSQWISPNKDQYTIEVYKNGKINRIIERTFQSRSRSNADFELIDRMKLSPKELSDYWPDVYQIRVDNDGNIWVETSRSAYQQPDGIFKTYDVFDPVGHFVKQVSIQLEGNNKKDVLFFIDSERIILVKGNFDFRFPGVDFNQDLTEIICYEISSRE